MENLETIKTQRISNASKIVDFTLNHNGWCTLYGTFYHYNRLTDVLSREDMWLDDMIEQAQAETDRDKEIIASVGKIQQELF
jgi:hypothetical protein